MLSRYALKQYIWNLFVNGFLMSYIVPPTIRRFLLNVLGCEIGGGCPKTYWDIKQIALVNFYLFYYSCLTLYIIETQLFCLYL